jgi:hypothetical protein
MSDGDSEFRTEEEIGVPSFILKKVRISTGTVVSSSQLITYESRQISFISMIILGILQIEFISMIILVRRSFSLRKEKWI